MLTLINFYAVIVSAVAAFIIGFLMHGPVAGKLWMRLANIHPTGNEKLSDMTGQMFWNLVVNLVTSFFVAILFALSLTSPFFSGIGVWDGILCGLFVWFGFMITTTSIDVIWMGKSVKLWFFEVVSSLIVMTAVGAIIGAWR